MLDLVIIGQMLPETSQKDQQLLYPEHFMGHAEYQSLEAWIKQDIYNIGSVVVSDACSPMSWTCSRTGMAIPEYQLAMNSAFVVVREVTMIWFKHNSTSPQFGSNFLVSEPSFLWVRTHLLALILPFPCIGLLGILLNSWLTGGLKFVTFIVAPEMMPSVAYVSRS